MIHGIRSQIQAGNHRFTVHALERCVERAISPREIAQAVYSGEIIEYYPEDKYGASCLIRGLTQEGRVLHIQSSIAPVWIITAYDPTMTPEEWNHDFRQRRSR